MRINVRVQPGASKEQLVKNSDGGIKVYLKAPPLGGQANKVLIKILAAYFHTTKTNIKILTGKQSRNKLVEVSN